MNTKRKILIVAGALCLIGVCLGVLLAAILAGADKENWAFASLGGAVLCWWIGSGIAETLKQTREK